MGGNVFRLFFRPKRKNLLSKISRYLLYQLYQRFHYFTLLIYPYKQKQRANKLFKYLLARSVL